MRSVVKKYFLSLDFFMNKYGRHDYSPHHILHLQMVYRISNEGVCSLIWNEAQLYVYYFADADYDYF